MSRFETLDLSALPAPLVVKNVSYEAIRASRLADLKTRMEADGLPFDVETLETDPAVILQEEGAFFEALDRVAINDAARAVMLAFSRGADLDNLAAFYGIKRRLITPADATTSPPTEAVYEKDDELLARCRVALEGLAEGLTGGGYAHLAMLAAPEVSRVALIKAPGGRITLILQGRAGDGSVSDDVITKVATALEDDKGGQLTDVILVRSVAPVAYEIVARLKLPRGPSALIARDLSADWLFVAAEKIKAKGWNVTTDALIAAGRVPSAVKFELLSPTADLVVAADQIAACSQITVIPEVVDG